MTKNTPEPINVDSESARCDGGLADLGHPRVYLLVGANGHVDCPYCGQRFILSPKAEEPSRSDTA